MKFLTYVENNLGTSKTLKYICIAAKFCNPKIYFRGEAAPRRHGYKGGGDRSMSPPQFSNDSPINYSVESLATSSRPQRQCARFNFCYIDNFSDDEIV